MSSLLFVRRRAFGHVLSPILSLRGLRTSSVRLDISSKYLDKVQKRAQEKGVSVEELKETVRKADAAKPTPIPEAVKLKQRVEKVEPKAHSGVSKSARKDNSPVRPLMEIMDIHKLLRTPHTKEQISTLWTAYHSSRSGGTGRGYLSASVPIPTYETILKNAKKYPNFVVAVPRLVDAAEEGKQENGYEFFFQQWTFHEASPIPSPSAIDTPIPEGALPPPSSHPLATVLYTPLLEYRLHQTFATPHLVLTLYPELSESHGVVLLRGEITPSTSGAPGQYLLSQNDAQLLAHGLQRFYLENKDNASKERVELLKTFNENPTQFKWEDLLKHADPTS